MNLKEGMLVYDEYRERYDVRFGLEEYYGGLHCGETFLVNINNKWVPTRIEKDEDWYLVDIKTSKLSGLKVRI